MIQYDIRLHITVSYTSVCRKSVKIENKLKTTSNRKIYEEKL